MKETNQPTDPPKKPDRPTGEVPVTDPDLTTQPKEGFLHSLFKHPASGPKPEPIAKPLPGKPRSSEHGKMALGEAKNSNRILNEKRVNASPMIPLPDEDAFSVNLLTEDLVSNFDARKQLLKLGLLGLGAVALVGAAIGALTLYGRTIHRDIDQTKADLASVQMNIKELDPQRQQIDYTVKKVQSIKGLIDQHIHWTNFFRHIEKYTLPEVTYGASFTGDLHGSFILSARTNSFENVARQYLVFQQAVKNHDFISAFTITGASRQTNKEVTTVGFTIGLTVLPTIFTTSPVAASTAPSSTNTQAQPEEAGP